MGACFSVCLLPCPLGTVLSSCLSVALHMACVVGGVSRRTEEGCLRAWDL